MLKTSKYLTQGLIFAAVLWLAACEEHTQTTALTDTKSPITIFTGEIVTMDKTHPTASALAVQAGKIIGIGSRNQLARAFPQAQVDTQFNNKTIMPGLIDPHIHMALSSIQYALPITPPWEMATRNGIIDGYPTREAFLTRIREIEAQTPKKQPLIIYGYHNLVHGTLTRKTLDSIAQKRPLFIWHYSSHDFYLNSAALKFSKIKPSQHAQFEGVEVDANGNLTGRIYEDAIPLLLHSIGHILFNPELLARGMRNFSHLLNKGGVTSVADLAYGIFGFPIEDANIKQNWESPQKSGYRLFLVPEHRAFLRKFGETRIDAIKDMIAGRKKTPAPVLSQVKFFTDAAFYSQTMRLSPPGYLSGQSKGKLGLWVIPPGQLADTIRPYWDAGLDVRIHSNGDAAQDASLDALAQLRPHNADNKFIFEHAGLFSPHQVKRAGALRAGISAASHYVYYMGEIYQKPLGEKRGDWILPLNTLSKQNIPVTLHSDAPLAPPLPLRAASVHVTRATREGGQLTKEQALTPYDALEAITLDAAYALGLEGELGSISLNKRADFTILGQNPLAIDATLWNDIEVWGVVLDGTPRANPTSK